MDMKRAEMIKSEAAVAADSTDGLIIKQRKGSNDTETTGSEDSRESWDNKAQYILAVVGFAVGLGNVWRFPYLAQKNGGGAFLIPYTIMLAIEGIPIFYLELALGQRLRKGAVGVWNDISPYLGGIGIASAIVSFWVGFYYNTIIAWCLYYLVQSFMSPLPWAECPTRTVGNVTVVEEECQISSPTTYFWYRETLNIAGDVADGGSMNWWIVVSLLVAWIIVFVCIFKGIASSGKVVYFTATFPYLVLVIFFFRGVTLDGFQHGVHHFFVPDFGRLVDPQVWLDAATQIFFSLGLAFGGLIAFASYMPVRNNCFKDAVLVSVVNCGTSVFAGVVVFSILGFKATQSFNNCMMERNAELQRLFNSTYSELPTTGTLVNFTMFNNDTNTWYTVVGEMPELPTCDLKQEIEKSASGTGLVFMAFTEAINQFPVAQLWSVLFFLMLLTLGLDSMFGMVESVVTSLMDLNLIPKAKKWHYFTGICGGSFVMSLCFANQAGAYIFTLFDEYSGNIPLLIVALSQVLAVSYIYGLKRFGDDIELMTGQRPNWYWMACWKYISPLAMTVILLASLGNMFTGTTYEAWHSHLGENVTKPWPWWCKFLAAFLILTPTLWIPGVAIVKYLRLYNWSQSEPAFFPREQLQEELALKKTCNNKQSSNFRSTWERKLFYWMPVCGVTYENEAKVQEQCAAEEENASIDSGEESPC
ncbi:sodium-dependent neutral amino acid transporter B(0)AT3-like [Ruditapes philippinarum]|uniref:sodium-dependent neutral amino acid transporter B(0)AT3-like n=1 Tax=Ruditapes philippinarum TaxID=129788 RepID=UPI00295ACF54|nr:sodium-dependent neutral amino acid transporter B(0)AT3-like [Ruditapes philippinarum]